MGRDNVCFVEWLRRRVDDDPCRLALTFLVDGEREERHLTYGELDAKARAIAAHLQALSLAGERVLLLLPPGLDYISAFLGCLYAGVVAVPASPPTGRRALPRLQAILADCGPRAILTTAALGPNLQHLASPLVEVDRVGAAGAADWRETACGAEDLAFLQYTSGSTSAPKGVRVTHGNLFANQRMIREAFGTSAASVIASWLPPYHDMGLIGGLLHPLYLGARCVLLSPLHFLQRPRRWLEAISRHGVTVSGGPNFAYDLCARRAAPGPDPGEPLDLSGWRVAFNGAEPIHPEALERFAAAFSGAGFRRAAYFPCYGLAEATLLVSGGRAGDEVAVFEADAAAFSQGRVEEAAKLAPADTQGGGASGKVRRLVGCGRVDRDLAVRLVDPASGAERAAGEVGEIWVAGGSVAQGYWGKPGESAATFGRRLAGHPGAFLSTGDLGFIRGGELFIAGRAKDLIIIRGRNFHPQDIEWTAAGSHPSLRPGGAAAFAVEAEGEERLVVVQETALRGAALLAKIAEAIRRAVAEEHEVQVSHLVLVRTGAVPKTTSGKVQRRACRERWLRGELPVLGEWGVGERTGGERVAPRTPAEQRVARIWEEVLGLAPGTVGVDEDFFSLGGDSLRAGQLLARLQEADAAITLEDLFAGPTIVELAARLVPGRESGEPATALGRADRNLPLPLTSTQRRLWFLDQLEPGNPAYNLALSLRLAGDLDRAACAASLAEIVRRHEALRTVFRVVDGAPVQLVLSCGEAGSLAVPLVDLSGLADAAGARAAAACEWEVARRPFVLSQGPLLHACLVRLAADEHRLYLALHHIVSDGWSLGVLLRELAEIYPAFARRAPSPLPELAVQFADFAAWQESRRLGPDFAARLAAWQQRLGDRPPVLELPADRPRPPVQGYRGAHLARLIPAPLEGELRTLAGACGASLFMALLAGFLAVLQRTTAQEDLVLGTAAANRERVELEGLIGCFVNTLPLRTEVAGDPPFTELLGRVRTTVLAALADRDLPFEQLVERLGPGRDLSRPPLVQVMVVQQSAPVAIPRWSGLALAAREVDNGTARFDLALSLLGTEEGLTAVWKYSRDLFDAVTIERLSRHFAHLLDAAARAPGARLSELPLLTAAERQQVVWEWNATAAGFSQAAGTECLHQLFAAQVGRTPEAVAAVYEARALTYRELDRQSDRLARVLRRLGVAAEVLVGVAMERSSELIVGLLGVLKAGGAYLPLDPAFPTERLAGMLEDAAVPILLTHERLRRRLPAGRARVLCLDAPLADPGGLPGGRCDPAVELSPENLAYTIFTSGSTGRPKGSMISHRGIVNRLLWMQEAYGLLPGEGVLQKTPTSFDVSVWELFWPLVVGARLILARPGGQQDSAYLAGLIADEEVTTLHFVPSMLQVFLEEPRLRTCPALKRVIASGEALPRELAARFADLLGEAGVRLHNLYGPTEASVDVTAWACGAERDARSAVPIGRPITNLRIRLLDLSGSPVPVGVPGHLHIAGVGLARGYLGRPDRTAERFVPDPFDEGGRLYATGDLARLRPDGAIEFLGRLDHQVKLRGFRIELGEIEAALDVHPTVRESVVVALRESAGLAGPRLVAYVVGRGGETAAPDELRTFLSARLPDYMVPATFVALPALPLTPSGKVDRKALPVPAAAGGKDAGWVAPGTPVEKRLAALWEEQLRVARVGAQDNFFALGGDSIQGALFINRLQRELSTILYVMALFDAPTVARFAAYLEASYSQALASAGWIVADDEGGTAAGRGEEELDPAVARAELARHLATRFSPARDEGEVGSRNPRAIFILSPFRSGSTLLRVMLAGHPGLFAPPELELLGFTTMGERRRVFAGRDRFAREGLLRALMELEGCDAEAAEALVAAAEEREEPVRAFYGRLQEAAGARILVDKTPRYSLDLPTLRRAESWFENATFLHLVRHPHGTIHSYLDARLDEVYRFPLPRRQQAELVWSRSHENIREFLAAVPPGRQCSLRFEDLVESPGDVMAELCSFLGLAFHPAVLSPYVGGRMTDGLRGGRMMGDPRFHDHRGIEAEVAGRWRTAPHERRLDPATWRLAERLGYARSDPAPEARPEGRRRRDSEDEPDLPLSFAQQRLWFLDRLEGPSSTYNMPAAVRLRGSLAVPALARAGAEIERRHEVLRTVFPESGGRPRQLVKPPRVDLLPFVDLGALPELDRRAEAARLLAAEVVRPFDLTTGPLWRLRLVRLGAEEHLLFVNLHHIVCDGWSIGVLTRELVELYGAFRLGRRSPLPELPLQYADFALWQRRRLSGEVLEEHLRYWRGQLAEPLPVLALPTDRPRPAVPTYRGGLRSLIVPPALVERLKALGYEGSSTLFMVLVAAFQTLLQAYTGQVDLLISTVAANRNRAEIEDLIGAFVNTLLLRTSLAGDPEFRALLARVRQVCLGAARHEDLPFEKLVEEVSLTRALGHPSLDAVVLALQNAPRRELALPGLAVERLAVPSGVAKAELTLDLTERQGGLAGTFEYNADLFDVPTVERLASHFLEILGSVVEGPGRRLGDLPFLAAAERQQILVEWNATAVAERPAIGGLHELVEAQVERTPEAVAVAFESRSLTYGELDRRAGRLARLLKGLGVAPEVLVGVAAERSPEVIVGLLAVLKAGGAYLPLDPAYPGERLAFMLADAGIDLLLTQEHLRERLPAGVTRVLCLDSAWGRAGDLEETADDAGSRGVVLPDNLAYTIYTSGSTGLPKGSQISHRSIVDHLCWIQRRLPVGPADVLVLKTPLSFDASIWELFLPLAWGARIEVARPEGERDVAYLARLVARSEATVLQVVPSMLAVLLEEPGLAACASLRRVLCGSEALPAQLGARFQERLDCELHNLYGPTECSIDATHWPCAPRHSPRTSRAPTVAIGRPIDNVQVYLLDPWSRPVPVGAPGHLHVGGLGLARGYLGKADLTAEKFLPNPYGIPGGRLYATGDLARLQADGTVEFLGRLDHQVKIRGFRIELGEVEACLNAHPAVREAVVLAREERGRAGGLRLVAYVVGHAGVPPEVGELRSFLAARLPGSMVPSVFMVLPALPLGPSEKVDRARLPEPSEERPGLAVSYVSPRSAHERLIAEVWRDVLGLERIGIHDNFFDLGGHSLLAAEVHGRLRERLQLDFPLLDLFQYPTVHALAGRLHGQEAEAEHRDPGDPLDQARRERQAVQRRRQALARQRDTTGGPVAALAAPQPRRGE